MMSMENERPTQCDRIQRWLEEVGEIDSSTAMRELGVYRLASRISEMKKRGMNIKREMRSGINRFGEKVSWAVYSLA